MSKVIGGAVVIQFILNFNIAYATCTDGTKAVCRINGKPGTKTCENGKWSLCEEDANACPGGRLGDARNCGACGHRCPGNQSCQDSVCGCGSLTACAPTECRNLASDPLNCGRCGSVCPSGQICHAGNCGMETGTRPLDLFWKRTDVNGLPLNPDWIARSTPTLVSSKHVDLHNACSPCMPTTDGCEASSDIACWRKCTSYPSLGQDIANLCKLWCNHGGHLNWFPATYTGSVSFKDYAAAGVQGSLDLDDDDANFTFLPDEDAGLLGRDDVIHSEMSSIETINRFQSGWWLAFHDAVHESRDAGRAMVPGNRAIIIGLVGFDMQHNIHVELHPIYAMAIELESNPAKNRWAIFARNWGNEGFCGRSSEHELPLREIFFSLPGPVGVTGAPVATGVTEKDRKFSTDGSATAVSEAFFINHNAVIAFQLDDPGDETEIDGEITLEWTLPAGIAVAKPKQPVRPVLAAAASEKDELPGVELLTPTQVKELNATLSPTPTRDKSRNALVPKRVPFKMPAKPVTALIPGDVTRAPDLAKQERDLQGVQMLCAMLKDNPEQPKFCSTVPPGPPR